MVSSLPAKRTFAERLDHLFCTVRQPGNKPYSYNAAADGIKALGTPITAAYLHQLRTGKRTNPSIQHVEAIAEFFGVPAAYFFDDAIAATVERDLELLDALQDGGVRVIALEARGLSKGSQQAILNVIKQLAQTESRVPDRKPKPTE